MLRLYDIHHAVERTFSVAALNRALASDAALVLLGENFVVHQKTPAASDPDHKGRARAAAAALEHKYNSRGHYKLDVPWSPEAFFPKGKRTKRATFLIVPKE